MKQFLENKFIEAYDVTIGVDFGSKLIDVGGKQVKALIWDTAGTETFKSITKTYYNNVAGAALVYDITKKSTFLKLPQWMQDIRNARGDDITIIIVGNKYDLRENREVSIDEGMKYAESIGCKYMETSAKSGANVVELFKNLSEQVLIRYARDKNMIGAKLVGEGITVQITPEAEQKEKPPCC